MFMALSSWQSHCESSPGSFYECRTSPSGRQPKTKLDVLGCESACTGCQSLHPPSPLAMVGVDSGSLHDSPFIIITQPKSWYSVYHPTEGRRLSWPDGWIAIRFDWFALQGSPHLTPVLLCCIGSALNSHFFVFLVLSNAGNVLVAIDLTGSL